MATQNIQDYTDVFNDFGGNYNIDCGGWDYAVVQLIQPAGSITFLTTNDSGDITGVSDGSAISATNFVEVMGTNLTTNTGVTSLATDGLVRFESIGRYLRLQSDSANITKLLVRFYKIS